MTYLEESQAAGREIFPDLARAWALFGIALVNVGVLAWPMASSYHGDGGIIGSLDQAAFFAVGALFMMKSYSLFSFMFGVGFAYQMKSAERRGVGFSGRYWRRIIGLFAFGALNISLFFIGDILVIYAVLGSLLFCFRNSSVKTLKTWGIVIYSIQIVIVCLIALAMYAGATFAPEEMAETYKEFATMNAADTAAFGGGTLSEAILHRVTVYATSFPMMLMFQGFGAFAFFLFGLAAVRSGVIADPAAPIWKRARRVALPLGLIVSSAGAWILINAHGMSDPSMFFGMALITIGSPLSTAGYLGVIAKLSQGPVGPIKAFFARGGTASLTAYLMQGLIFSVTFSAYGLGYFAQWSAAQCVGFAFLVALFTVAFASLWRTIFTRGPMEMILRGWTYMGAR